jgi:Ca2+-binding RTX toxin-like protein
MGAFARRPRRKWLLATLAAGLALGIASVAIADVVTGTNGPDNLTGTDGPDTISALSGNDTVSALDGADDVAGGFGNDDINAGHGNDTVNGGFGADTIVSPNDGPCNVESEVLVGGPGNDTITQRDTTFCETSVLRGDANADTLDAADGDSGDTLNGGAGPFDVCTGDPGDTYVGCEAIDDGTNGLGALTVGGGTQDNP